MKTILLAFLSLVSTVLAQDPPHLAAAQVAQSKFSLLNKVVGLSAYTANAKEISATQTKLDFGDGLTCTFPTAYLINIDVRKNRIIYVLIQSFQGDSINGVIMGNHVGYDLSRKAVYSWQRNGDR